MCNPNENDKELRDDDEITTFLYGSNIRFIKCFDNKDKYLPNSIEDIAKENIKIHNPNWPEISDHPYIILTIGGSGSKDQYIT